MRRASTIMTVFIYIDFEKKGTEPKAPFFERSVTAAPGPGLCRPVLVHKHDLLARLETRLHLGHECVNLPGLCAIKRAILVNLLKHRHVRSSQNHGLVTPMKQFKVAIIVRLVEFLLRLERSVLVHGVDKALDIHVINLTQLVSPLGQREVDRLTLRGVLERHRRKLDHLSVPDPMVRETLGGAGHVSSGHSRP